MTIIYLIRHATNQFVDEGKLAGRITGVHLNELGQAQAKALAVSLSSTKLKAIYTSPLERAVETAAPIAKNQGRPLIKRKGLAEIRYGRWEGKSLKTLRRRKLWHVVQATPSLARFPEGESFPEAQARIVNEVEVLRQKHPTPKAKIALVSHADMIKLAIAHYVGLPLDLFQRLIVNPASISILAIGKRGSRLLRLNDTIAAGPERHG